MGDTGMRGTTADQDSRFANKEAIALKQTKFPKHFSEKVDLRKVNISVLRAWVATKVTTLIGLEDDIVVEFVFGMLEDKDNPTPDPRKMQISLTGFMDKYGAAEFMDKLWTLLLSAQATVGGVPAEFIAAKKAELERKQLTDKSLDDQMMARKSAIGGRDNASDSFDRRRDGPNGPQSLPPRPGRLPERGLDRLPPRRSPPPRDDSYRRGPPPRRFDRDVRDRDSGYGSRYAPPRERSRSRSPRGYRRRSPSPRRRSPSPRRRRSPSPKRPRDRSITPPLRGKRLPSREREPARKREDTPPVRRRRSPSPVTRSISPARPRRTSIRGRSKSRTPTPDDTRSRSVSRSRSRSRERSPTITPPRKRARSRSITPTPPRRKYSASPGPPPRKRSVSPPPRRRRRSSASLSPRRRSPSPPPRRRIDSPKRDDEGIVKKGRGRFTTEDEVPERKSKLEGPLKKSKWAQDD